MRKNIYLSSAVNLRENLNLKLILILTSLVYPKEWYYQYRCYPVSRWYYTRYTFHFKILVLIITICSFQAWAPNFNLIFSGKKKKLSNHIKEVSKLFWNVPSIALVLNHNNPGSQVGLGPISCGPRALSDFVAIVEIV